MALNMNVEALIEVEEIEVILKKYLQNIRIENENTGVVTEEEVEFPECFLEMEEEDREQLIESIMIRSLLAKLEGEK